MERTKSIVSKTQTVCFRVHPVVKEELARTAKKQGLTLSQYMEPLLIRALHDDGANLTINVDLAEVLQAKRA